MSSNSLCQIKLVASGSGDAYFSNISGVARVYANTIQLSAANNVYPFYFDTDGLFKIHGTTNAYPALKRSGTGIQARLADDSAFTYIDAYYFDTGGSAVYGNFIRIGDPSNNAYIDSGSNAIFFTTLDSSHPALKRNGAYLEARLADDSGFARFGASICGGEDFDVFGSNEVDNFSYRNASFGGDCTGLFLPADWGIKWADTNASSGTDIYSLTKNLGLIPHDSTSLEINNGTPGTLRDLTLRSLLPNGNMLFGTDGTYDIGTFNNYRPNVIYAANSFRGTWYGANQNSGISDTSDAGGELTLANGAFDGFKALNLGPLNSATNASIRKKAVASIADATATAVFTVTIPNAAHSACLEVTLNGRSGAGGAIGADESSQVAKYLINVTRTLNLNAVAAIGATFGQPAAVTVTGGNAVAVVGTISAISGTTTATNTFDIKVTITKAGGGAANHTCTATVELLNSNASGVTIS